MSEPHSESNPITSWAKAATETVGHLIHEHLPILHDLHHVVEEYGVPVAMLIGAGLAVTHVYSRERSPKIHNILYDESTLSHEQTELQARAHDHHSPDILILPRTQDSHEPAVTLLRSHKGFGYILALKLHDEHGHFNGHTALFMSETADSLAYMAGLESPPGEHRRIHFLGVTQNGLSQSGLELLVNHHYQAFNQPHIVGGNLIRRQNYPAHGDDALLTSRSGFVISQKTNQHPPGSPWCVRVYLDTREHSPSSLIAIDKHTPPDDVMYFSSKEEAFLAARYYYQIFHKKIRDYTSGNLTKERFKEDIGTLAETLMQSDKPISSSSPHHETIRAIFHRIRKIVKPHHRPLQHDATQHIELETAELIEKTLKFADALHVGIAGPFAEFFVKTILQKTLTPARLPTLTEPPILKHTTNPTKDFGHQTYVVSRAGMESIRELCQAGRLQPLNFADRLGDSGTGRRKFIIHDIMDPRRSKSKNTTDYRIIAYLENNTAKPVSNMVVFGNNTCRTTRPCGLTQIFIKAGPNVGDVFFVWNKKENAWKMANRLGSNAGLKEANNQDFPPYIKELFNIDRGNGRNIILLRKGRVYVFDQATAQPWIDGIEGVNTKDPIDLNKAKQVIGSQTVDRKTALDLTTKAIHAFVGVYAHDKALGKHVVLTTSDNTTPNHSLFSKLLLLESDIAESRSALRTLVERKLSDAEGRPILNHGDILRLAHVNLNEHGPYTDSQGSRPARGYVLALTAEEYERAQGNLGHNQRFVPVDRFHGEDANASPSSAHEGAIIRHIAKQPLPTAQIQKRHVFDLFYH